MGFFSGCMDARNMTSIEEVKCPKCSADMEVFVRDGKTVGDSVCDNCGYTIKENQIDQDEQDQPLSYIKESRT